MEDKPKVGLKSVPERLTGTEKKGAEAILKAAEASSQEELEDILVEEMPTALWMNQYDMKKATDAFNREIICQLGMRSLGYGPEHHPDIPPLVEPWEIINLPEKD